MRILILTQYFWPEDFRINEIAESLQNEGHYVEVLTGIPNYPKGNFYEGYGFFKKTNDIYKGIPIKRVWIMPRGKGSKIGLFINYISFVISASLRVLNPYYRKFDMILVYEVSPITQALPGIFMRALYRVPLCMYVFDLWPESLQAAGNINSSLILKTTGYLVDFIYRNCDSLLISSRSFKKNILQYGFPESSITYIPSWPESDYLPVEKLEGKKYCSDMPKEKFIVMYAGNIGLSQGFKVIMDAAIELRNENIAFVILGDGRLKEWAINECQKFQLNNVYFLGRKPREMMSAYFSQADVMIVTLRKHPIFSLTLPGRVLSYLACGKPIIASADGETAEIILEAKAGLTCPAEDGQALARAILSLKKMTISELRTLGANGFSYAQKEFNKHLLIKRLEKALFQVSCSKDLNETGNFGVSK